VTGADPMEELHPVARDFITRVLRMTTLHVKLVVKPALPIRGSWRVGVSNGKTFVLQYRRAVGGAFWFAELDGRAYNLSYVGAQQSLAGALEGEHE